MVCGLFDRRLKCYWTDHVISLLNIEEKNARTKLIIAKKLNHNKTKLPRLNKIDSRELGFL
jgi:hypothetical protein